MGQCIVWPNSRRAAELFYCGRGLAGLPERNAVVVMELCAFWTAFQGSLESLEDPAESPVWERAIPR